MKWWRLATVALLALALGAGTAMAQSQAANGTIEGTVKDSQGGLLPGVTVTVTHLDTSTPRVVITNERGVYRAPLLPLGTFSVAYDLTGFGKQQRTGITLSAGQTVVLNISLAVGGVSEDVIVSR
jgi:hypothetical protein